jgi:hypothetical protein
VDDRYALWIDVRECQEIAPRRLRVGYDSTGPRHLPDRRPEDARCQRRCESGAHSSRGKDEENEVVTGHDRPGRVQIANEIALSMIDYMTYVRSLPPSNSRIAKKPAHVGVQFVHRPEPQCPSREDVPDTHRSDRHASPAKRSTQPLSIEEHAHLRAFAVVMEQGDAGRHEEACPLVAVTAPSNQQEFSVP